jgi:hypothetical protein
MKAQVLFCHRTVERSSREFQTLAQAYSFACMWNRTNDDASILAVAVPVDEEEAQRELNVFEREGMRERIWEVLFGLGRRKR